MRRIGVVVAAVFAVAMTLGIDDAFAQGHGGGGGGHGGGGASGSHGGGSHGSGGQGGHYDGGHHGGHGGYYGGYYPYWGLGWAWPGYGYYSGYPYYSYPYAYEVVPPVYGELVPPAPQVQAQAAWYYCTNPAGYYPYVQTCNEPWMPVQPTQ